VLINSFIIGVIILKAYIISYFEAFNVWLNAEIDEDDLFFVHIRQSYQNIKNIKNNWK